MEIEQTNIKNQINEFCTGIYSNAEGRGSSWGVPILILVYFGKESEKCLKEEVEDAFRTMLTVQPVVRSICIDERIWGDADDFGRELRELMEEINEKGYFVQEQPELQISYLGIMNDPLLCRADAEEILGKMQKEIEELQSLGVSFRENAFYGVFDQTCSIKKYNYKDAFSFVRFGSFHEYGLWKKVYHLQKSFLSKSYEKVGRAVAMQMIYDFLFPNVHGMLVEKKSSPYYRWSSLGLEEMKIPEQILCNILITGYRKQVRNEKQTQASLDRLLDAIPEALTEYLKNSSQVLSCRIMTVYLPQRPEAKIPADTGRSRRRQEFLRTPSYEERMLDKSLLEVMISDQLEETGERLRKYEGMEQIFRKALSVLYVMDENTVRMADSVTELLDVAAYRLENRGGSLRMPENMDSMEEYRDQLFSVTVEKQVLLLAAEILRYYAGEEEFECRLREILNRMKEENAKLVHNLDILRVNQYGGAMALDLPVLAKDFAIRLNTGVAEACRQIPETVLDELVRNDTLLKKNTGTFILRAEESARTTNSLGSLTGEFSKPSSINYTMMSCKETDVTNMVSKAHSFFRRNTLQVLFSGEWESQCNLKNYYREADDEI